jgi:hypothetical protein
MNHPLTHREMETIVCEVEKLQKAFEGIHEIVEENGGITIYSNHFEINIDYDEKFKISESKDAYEIRNSRLSAKIFKGIDSIRIIIF